MKKMLKYTTFALLIMTITRSIGLEGTNSFIANKVLFILFVFADKCKSELEKNIEALQTETICTEGGALDWKTISSKVLIKQLYKLPKQAIQSLL